jgi:hypothetical protein
VRLKSTWYREAKVVVIAPACRSEVNILVPSATSWNSDNDTNNEGQFSQSSSERHPMREAATRVREKCAGWSTVV